MTGRKHRREQVKEGPHARAWFAHRGHEGRLTGIEIRFGGGLCRVVVAGQREPDGTWALDADFPIFTTDKCPKGQQPPRCSLRMTPCR